MENNYLTVAMNAALQAGHAIMQIYSDPAADFEVERKADNSPLTVADKRANEVILSFLNQTPYPVLSEEGKAIPYEQRREWETLWIVDPLDGTKEFIKRNGEFTVNIALVKNGIPMIGVIYVPVTNVMYIADEERAFKLTDIQKDETSDTFLFTSLPLTLPFAAPHNGLVVVASRSHLNEETERFIEELKQQHEVELITSGSSLKICLVAEGSADLYPRFAPTMEWDTAAGHAIARAAGCELYCYGSDRPLQYNKEELLNPWFIVQKARTDK